MDPLSQARAMAIARVGIGVVLSAAPRILLRPWVGKANANRPAVKMLSRSVGARDVALGVGALLAIKHDAPVRGWLEAGVMSDAGDVLGILMASRGLPRFGVVAGIGAAVSAAVAGRRAVAALASEGDESTHEATA